MWCDIRVSDSVEQCTSPATKRERLAVKSQPATGARQREAPPDFVELDYVPDELNFVRVV